MQRIASGVIDQVVYFFAPPGLTGHTVDRARNATSLSAMTTPTVTEMADGLYALLLDEDMDIDGGNLTEAMSFMVKAAGMSDTPIYVELFDPTEYTVGTVTVNTDMRGTDSAATAAALVTVDTVVDAIKVQTDKMIFTIANQLDVNIQYINDVALVGDGSATPFNV